ncbi:MAG: putative integral rane protein [Frankiales bacterium]|nr:putative integral rane protein [Frankiales bacterium]
MSLISTAKTALPRARQKAPFLDHVIRMYGRYQADGGDRLAAAVTFYWFLSLFPILLLAISLLGYVYGDAAPRHVTSALSGYLPSQLVKTIGDTLVQAKGKAGVIGLVGLLLSGLGWVDGLREAIRSIWHQNIKAGNIITRKLADIVVLIGLFATIAASIVVTGATTAATGFVIGLIGLSHTTAATVFTQVLAYLLSAVADTMLFVYMFTRLPRVSQPISKVLRSAVFGAVGFEIIKFAGAFYVARTTSKGAATYGAFAVVVGLLLFLNLISRWILLTAAFAVTKPYDSDALPSGTATPEQARKAGIPPQFAENDDPDDPPVLVDDGAPTPLRPVVAGVPPEQDGEVSRTDQQSSVDPYPGMRTEPVPAAAPRPSAADLRGETAVRNAGRAGAAAMGVTITAVGVYAARTVRGVLARR